MFTQCSKCETVFRLSADALRAAGGQVRCGRCGEVFNALARLAEDATGFSKGESALFLETRAEEILEFIAPKPLEHDEQFGLLPGPEGAQLQFLEPLDDLAETSLEFTLPPGELDRIFVETRPSPLHQLTATGPRGERHDFVQLAPAAPPAAPAAPAQPAQRLLGPPPQPLPVHPESRAAESHAAPPDLHLVPLDDGQLTRVAGLEVSEDVRQELLASYSYPDLSDLQTRRPQARFFAWLSAAIVLGVLLVFQLFVGGGWQSGHLPLFGAAVSPTASLSVYQLRQWGVSSDPVAKGTLRVRASIMNTATQLQPYPLLRVSLVNRFGTRVGAREFEPGEYLGRIPARLIAPGERVDALLDILDPGKDAEGFEIDICIRAASRRIFCAGDTAAPAK